MRRSWLVALLALSAVNVMFLPGCPKPVETPDAGPGTEVEDSGVPDAGPIDAGFTCLTDDECKAAVGASTICWGAKPAEDVRGECIPRCVQDDDCEQFDQGLRCEDVTGRCIPARGCITDSNCPPAGFDPDDYCNITGVGCRCVTENNDTGFPGVCRRRRDVCSECTDDSQCGNGLTFEPRGYCRPLQGDQAGALPDGGVRKYCFNAPAGSQCPCGMVPSMEGGFCVPQKASCNSVGCSVDKDCPSGTVCDSLACLCEPRCVWNFDPSVQALSPPGCRPGETCWVDQANLDAESVFFGAGRCEPPCETDEQCKAALHDDRYVCKGEKIAGGESGKRCRPAGCMDDWECPPPPAGSLELGYCDRHSFSCKTDCRLGTDPMTGQAYDDCITGYKCANENGENRCVQQTCVELGGARVACNSGQFCCGEDKDLNGIADPCPPSGIESNQCYNAPTPPFCTTCESHDDCRQYANPSGSQLPAFCMYAGDRPDGSQGVNMCAMATFNDFTTDQNGVPKAFKGCPAKYAATAIKVDCTSNAECDPAGAPGMGNCGPDMTQTLPDGGHPNVCLCTATGDGTSQSNCPHDPNDPNAVQSWCRYAPQGAQTQCVQSVLCTPSPGVAYKSPAEYGCGL